MPKPAPAAAKPTAAASPQHTRYEAAVNEGLTNEDDELGVKRFRQVVQHLPPPNAQTYAWMRTAILRVASSLPVGGALSELVAERVPDLLEVLHEACLEPKPSQRDTLFFPSAQSHKRLCKYLASATVSLDVCVFTITDDEIAKTLVERHKHGVKVRVISDDAQAWCKGADVFELSERGIECVVDDEIEVFRKGKLVEVERHMHHKVRRGTRCSLSLPSSLPDAAP